ncbi:MAG: gluconate 2-dehydrogenase subunit 3 family protein, partial [Myxococcales bacterium]
RGHLETLARLGRRGLLGWATLALLGRRLRAQELPTDTFAVLDAAACRILPSDESAGAREAKVGRFIERQLAGSLAPLRPAFDQLARLLDLWSRKSFGKGFTGLSAAEQDAILGQLSRGEIPLRGFPQAAMFRALHTLTLEGFLSDPVHGGNDAQTGWRAIGFPEPHLRKPGGAHGH